MLSKLFFEGFEGEDIKSDSPITLLVADNMSFFYDQEKWPYESQSKIHIFWVMTLCHWMCGFSAFSVTMKSLHSFEMSGTSHPMTTSWKT
jgi:hypothetical protein